jgi:hypothetical protein
MSFLLKFATFGTTFRVPMLAGIIFTQIALLPEVRAVDDFPILCTFTVRDKSVAVKIVNGSNERVVIDSFWYSFFTGKFFKDKDSEGKNLGEDNRTFVQETVDRGFHWIHLRPRSESEFHSQIKISRPLASGLLLEMLTSANDRSFVLCTLKYSIIKEDRKMSGWIEPQIKIACAQDPAAPSE